MKIWFTIFNSLIPKPLKISDPLRSSNRRSIVARCERDFVYFFAVAACRRWSISIGSGKMIVEFFSAAISVSVCR